MSEDNGFKAGTAQDLLKMTDREFMWTPEIAGHKWRIRSLSEGERMHFDASNLDDKGNFDVSKLRGARCRLIAMCVVDEAGALVFSEPQVKQLEKVNSIYTVQLHHWCKVHNRFDDDDFLDATIKNSGRTSDDDSLSA